MYWRNESAVNNKTVTLDEDLQTFCRQSASRPVARANANIKYVTLYV